MEYINETRAQQETRLAFFNATTATTANEILTLAENDLEEADWLYQLIVREPKGNA